MRQELELNRTVYAERALEEYGQKMNLTEMSLARFGQNSTGLLHAQEMISRHQEILRNLILLYPNNTGLARAYNNSLFLELKFENKTEMRFARFIEKDNKTVLKAMRLENRQQNHNNDNNSTADKTMEQDRDQNHVENVNSTGVKNIELNKNQNRERMTDQKDIIPVNTTISPRPEYRNITPSGTISPQDNRSSSRDQGKKGRD
jgi:hypothetical protein